MLKKWSPPRETYLGGLLLMPEHEDVIVCMRVEDMPNPIKGSFTRVCMDCESKVWISKATARIKDSTITVDIICMRCAIENGVFKDHHCQPPSTDQVAEILDREDFESD